MTLSKEVFETIKSRYGSLLIIDADVEDVFHFVLEVIEAEADALKARIPYATNTIDRLEATAHELWSITRDVENEEFGKT